MPYQERNLLAAGRKVDPLYPKSAFRTTPFWSFPEIDSLFFPVPWQRELNPPFRKRKMSTTLWKTAGIGGIELLFFLFFLRPDGLRAGAPRGDDHQRARREHPPGPW